MESKFKRARVLTKFYDSEAKVMRNRGDIIKVTPVRFCEIVNKGKFLEVCPEPKKAAKPPKK